MCGAFVRLPIHYCTDVAWLHVMAEKPEKEKLHVFLDYSVNQGLENIHFSSSL